MKKRELRAIELGGTLYIPAVHKNLLPVCGGRRFPELRSVVVCTEDAILAAELPVAFDALRELLKGLEAERGMAIFFRPRDPGVLQKMLELEGIGKIDGFVLPKFDTQNMDTYLGMLEPFSDTFHIMPVMESREMLESDKLREIRERLLGSPLKTLCVRVGGEDMLRLFGLKRDCDTSLYALAACASVLADLLKAFRPYGFYLSAPVYNCIGCPETFRRETQEDLRQGFIGKTIIHPSQITPINDLYKVSPEELAMAQAMVLEETPAIIVQNGAMGEKFAHGAWAETILMRAKIYGIRQKNIR